jgi:hypothetical protein
MVAGLVIYVLQEIVRQANQLLIAHSPGQYKRIAIQLAAHHVTTQHVIHGAIVSQSLPVLVVNWSMGVRNAPSILKLFRGEK